MIPNNNSESLEATLLKSILINAGITVKHEVKKSLSDKTTVGFFCTASSLIRKATMISNLQKVIIENNIPAEIKEDGGTGFKVMIVKPTMIPSIAELKFTLSLATNYLSMAEICESNISRGIEVDWWKQKKIECLAMYQTLSKAI